jgi:hypothetical protein
MNVIAIVRLVFAAAITLIAALAVSTPPRAAETGQAVPCSILLSVRAADGAAPSANQLEQTLLIERKRMKAGGMKATAYATKFDGICITFQTARNYNTLIFTQTGKIAFKIMPHGPTYPSVNDRALSNAFVLPYMPYPALVIKFADPKAYNRFIGRYIGRNVAIMLDGDVKFIPTIHDLVGETGSEQIVGGQLTWQKANLWAALLSADPLPTVVRIVEGSTT